VTLSKKNYGLLFVLAALLIVGGCKKKETAPPPPPPPPPAAPTASLSANPDSVPPGQATTLTWRTENAMTFPSKASVRSIPADHRR